MAAALYFTLFCVLQVMTALSNVLAAPFNLTSGTVLQPHIMANINPEDPDAKHDKRSLNLWPFEPKYLSTQHYTLEIKDDGTVSASTRAKPPYGVLRIMAACLAMSTIRPSFDATKVRKNFGRVSIRGIKSEKYLCMNQFGEVFASDVCTDECEFKQEPIEEGGSPHNRYYSLKYKGFFRDPKRTKKKWYLGMKSGQVLKGHATRKRKLEVQFIQRPVSETSGPDSRYDTSTPPTAPVAEVDVQGGVQVFTSPDNKKRTERPRSTRPSKKNCDRTDPLNLFRLANCSRGKRTHGGSESARPFSPSHRVRHEDRKLRDEGSEDSPLHQRRDINLNLFSFPEEANKR